MALDPMSALSCATAVIQFVDFGTKLLSKSREIYQSTDGILEEQAEQAAISTRLSELSRRLSSSLSVDSNIRSLSAAEEALQDATIRCRTVADDFAGAVDKLRVSGGNRKWKSFYQAVKNIWNKEEVEQKLALLDRLQQDVVIHLLICINDNQTQASTKINDDISALEHTILATINERDADAKQEVHALRADLAKLSDQYGETKTRMSMQVMEQWRMHNETAIRDLLQQFRQEEKAKKSQSRQKKLLNTLYFEGINARENMIHGVASNTLEWVFDPPPESLTEWTKVADWLASPCSLYWVCGKAGSGKSTLMKWLAGHNRTCSLLESWARDKDIVTAKYFLWSPGSSLQKSLLGLLNSILRQLLEKCPMVASHIFPERRGSYDLGLANSPAWTVSELRVSLQTFIKIMAETHCLCLFIDGLDELGGKAYEREELLDFLDELSHHSTVKVCVSSRPVQPFLTAMSECPILRLEKLTRQDIENYTAAQLNTNRKFQKLKQSEEVLCLHLISEITERAKGVWLWVVLVIRSLLAGLTNMDTPSDLLIRLSQIPEELEDLFRLIISSIDITYRPKTLKLFDVMLNVRRRPTLMGFSFIDADCSNFHLGRCDPIPSQMIRNRLDLCANRIAILSGGLLETDSWHGTRIRSYKVYFLHRTARDFLLDSNLEVVLGTRRDTDFDPIEFACKAKLGEVKLLEEPAYDDIEDFIELLDRIVKKSTLVASRLFSDLEQIVNVLREKGLLRDLHLVIHTWAGTSLASLSGQCNEEQCDSLLPRAIAVGATDYAKSCLDRSFESPCTGRRPLLDIALRRRLLTAGQTLIGDRVDPKDVPDVEIVSMILRRGADPNEAYAWATVWELWLSLIYLFGPAIRLDELEHTRPFLDITELLIQHGVRKPTAKVQMLPLGQLGMYWWQKRQELYKRGKLDCFETFQIAFGDKEAGRLASLLPWSELSRGGDP